MRSRLCNVCIHNIHVSAVVFYLLESFIAWSRSGPLECKASSFLILWPFPNPFPDRIPCFLWNVNRNTMGISFITDPWLLAIFPKSGEEKNLLSNFWVEIVYRCARYRSAARVYQTGLSSGRPRFFDLSGLGRARSWIHVVPQKKSRWSTGENWPSASRPRRVSEWTGGSAWTTLLGFHLWFNFGDR